MASFEAIALAKLLDGDTELIQDLKKDFFTGKNLQIYTQILKAYSTGSKLPDFTIIKATIDANAPTTLKAPLVAAVDALEKIDVSIPNKELIKQLSASHVLRSVDGRIEELIEAQRLKDSDKVKSILSGIAEELVQQKIKVSTIMEAAEEDDNYSVVPTGLGEAYDELLGGGYSGVTVITAKSGAGKSILLQQCAVESYKAGKNVLYISLELAGKVLGSRIKSYLSGIPFNIIRNDKMSSEEAKLVDTSYNAAFLDKPNVFRVTTSQIDTDELLNVIKVQKQLYDIDLVIIDYLALVSPSKYDRGQTWETTANLVKRLHQYTMSENIVIVTASQVNEVKKSKDGLVPEITTRGTKELEFSATIWLHAERTEGADQEDGTSEVSLFMMKSRNSKKVHSIMQADFAHMRFVDQAVRLC